jgi:transposase-like protein
MEIRDVQVKQVDEKCPVCGKGWMRPTGIVSTSYPPNFQHKCTLCGYMQNYSVRYPYIIENE